METSIMGYIGVIGTLKLIAVGFQGILLMQEMLHHLKSLNS